MGEELWTTHPKGQLVGLSRKFLIVCPHHGKFVVSGDGNHSTIIEKRMKKMFPKEVANRLKEHLPPDEGRKFSRSLNGFHLPTSEDEALWNELVLKIIPRKP